MAESPAPGKGLAARWGGIPFYGAVLLQGLPLDRHLTPLRSRLAQDAQQQLVDRVTTVGATQSLLPALIWGTLYLFAFFLLARRSSSLQLRQLVIRQWPLFVLVVLGLFSVVWSPNIGKVMASSFHAVGITLVAMAAAIRCAAHAPSFVKTLSLFFAANLLVHLGCVVISPDLGIAVDGRWMGMAPHSNTLGGIALVGVWAGLTAAFIHRRKTSMLSLGSLALSVVVLYGSGSATSMLSALAVLGVGVFLLISTTWSRELKRLANVAISLWALGLALVLTASDSVMGMLTARLGKSDDFTGRSALWQQAWRLIKQHPVFGWGFDDNARVIVETGFNYPGFHNGYLDLGVRGGVVALALVLAALWCFLRTIVKTDRSWIQACLPMMAAFLMYNLMEVSLFSPKNVIWLVVVLLLFCTVLRVRHPSNGAPVHGSGRRHV